MVVFCFGVFCMRKALDLIPSTEEEQNNKTQDGWLEPTNTV